jgi:hypothetical protein
MARRPKAAELRKIILDVSEGSSMRQACLKLGVNLWQTYAAFKTETWSSHYACAREIAADFYAEKALALGLAAATGVTLDGKRIAPDGARVALDAIKWTVGRMWPASQPALQVEHSFGDLSSDERTRRIAELAARLGFASQNDAGAG